MKLYRFGAILLLFSFGALDQANAQSTINPDISVIPRFRLESSDGSQLPARRIFSQLELL